MNDSAAWITNAADLLLVIVRKIFISHVAFDGK